MKGNQLLLNTYYITTLIALNLHNYLWDVVSLAPICRWGNWSLEELSDLAKFSKLVNDRAQIHTKTAYLSMLCTSSCCLWAGGASRNLCQALACLHSHCLLALTSLNSVSQLDWPQAACNSTDICVNWLLIAFAIGWHWKEVGEGEEKNLGISLLPVHPWW